MNSLLKSFKDCLKLYQKYQFQNGLASTRVKKAVSISASELYENIACFKECELNVNDISEHVTQTFTDLIGSYVWISSSLGKKIKASVTMPKGKDDFLQDEKHRLIIRKVLSKKKIINSYITHADVFNSVYNELKLQALDPTFKTRLKFPKIDYTICLIPGMLNEFFKKTPFERGVEHLTEKYGVKYFTIDLPGSKGTNNNVKLLSKQLKDYVKKNPKEKLWLVAFSKGGIDTLQFMKKYSDFSDKHIVGLSTLATPILGTKHTNHKIIRLINKVNKFSDTKIYRKIDRGRDLLIKECQKTIAEDYRSPWLYRNRYLLPKNPFYTSLAFESKWHQTHLWLVFAKLFFNSEYNNDGVVESNQAQFPPYFKSINFGVQRGHHLISARSSSFNQEALMESLIITLNYLKFL